MQFSNRRLFINSPQPYGQVLEFAKIFESVQKVSSFGAVSCTGEIRLSVDNQRQILPANFNPR
jgi:hypothetical protein